MLKARLGGLYWPQDIVRRVLVPRPEGAEPPRIIDIGTGSGTLTKSSHNISLRAIMLGSWAVDMAHEFPHSKVIGFDLVPALLAR